ncbi:MAG: protein kinase [Polyangiaceae bacterium]
MELRPGELLGQRYRVSSRVGSGGMGEVWHATDERTAADVAIKVIALGLTHDPQARARFRREVQLISTVRDPSVVEVIDCIDTPNGSAIVMPLLRGTTLRRYILEHAPLSLDVSAKLFLQLIAGVSACHGQGVVHRDLKPDNVFLCAGLKVQILDFGVAKGYGPKWETLSRSNSVIGTPCYMAPEQAFGEPDVDFRADIWALGAMLYEALTGARPIEGENLGQVIRHLLVQGITPLQHLDPELPGDLCVVVMGMLSQDRAKRPPLAELQACLELHLDESARHSTRNLPPTPSARKSFHRRSLWLVGAAALVGLVVYWGQRFRHTPGPGLEDHVVIPAAAPSEQPELVATPTPEAAAPQARPQRATTKRRKATNSLLREVAVQSEPVATSPAEPAPSVELNPKPVSSQEGIQEEPPF